MELIVKAGDSYKLIEILKAFAAAVTQPDEDDRN